MSGQRTAHTAGPWRVGAEYMAGVPLYIGDMHFATVYRAKGADAHRNARLMATAPEMLEALEDAKRVIELIYPSSGYSDVPEVTLEKISAVLD